MKHRTLLAFCSLTLGASLLAACGGRYQTVREVEDDAPGGAGGMGSVGRAGSVAVNAGATSRAGATSSAGAGSGGTCANIRCNVESCPAGTMLQVSPGQCCPSCLPCRCPALACPSNMHPETFAGNCCPVCVDDDGPACQRGRDAYAVQRESIVNKYSYGCASDLECTTVAPLNSCEKGCSYASVWYGGADSFESNLYNLANMYCSDCKRGPTPPCVPPMKARCINGQCTQ